MMMSSPCTTMSMHVSAFVCAAGTVPYMQVFKRSVFQSVSRTSRAVRRRVTKFVLASNTNRCRFFPLRVFVAALLITYRTRARGKVPAKCLSVT